MAQDFIATTGVEDHVLANLETLYDFYFIAEYKEDDSVTAQDVHYSSATIGTFMVPPRSEETNMTYPHSRKMVTIPPRPHESLMITTRLEEIEIAFLV